MLLNSRAGAQGRGFITLQHVRRLGSVTLRRAKEVCHFVLTCAAYGPSVTHMPPPIAYTCTIPDQRACAVATGHYATTPGSVAQSRRKSQPCKQPAWSSYAQCACQQQLEGVQCACICAAWAWRMPPVRAVSAPTISAGFCARSGGTRKAIDTPAVCESFCVLIRVAVCGTFFRSYVVR